MVGFAALSSHGEICAPGIEEKPRESEDLVFCHNDFSTHNIIMDPATLKGEGSHRLEIRRVLSCRVRGDVFSASWAVCCSRGRVQ